MKFFVMMGFGLIFFVNYAQEINIKKNYYDLNRHATFLDQKFIQCQDTLKALYSHKKDLKTTLKILGATLGQCRNFQILLSHHIKNEKKFQSISLMKLMAAQNLFESYLIYQMLGLEKDEEAKQFAHTLELKLKKVIPAFKLLTPQITKK